jgi:hypothetical protein
MMKLSIIIPAIFDPTLILSYDRGESQMTFPRILTLSPVTGETQRGHIKMVKSLINKSQR